MIMKAVMKFIAILSMETTMITVVNLMKLIMTEEDKPDLLITNRAKTVKETILMTITNIGMCLLPTPMFILGIALKKILAVNLKVMVETRIVTRDILDLKWKINEMARSIMMI